MEGKKNRERRARSAVQSGSKTGDFSPELFNGPAYFYRHVGTHVFLPATTGQHVFQPRTDYPVSRITLDPAPTRIVKALFEHRSFPYLRRSRERDNP